MAYQSTLGDAATSWRAIATPAPPPGLGFDFLHVTVDNHSHYAYAEAFSASRLAPVNNAPGNYT